MSDNKDTILESLEKDEALKFFDGIPNAESVVTVPDNKDKDNDKQFFDGSDKLDFLDNLHKVEGTPTDKVEDTPVVEQEPDDTPEASSNTPSVVNFVNKLIEGDKLFGFEDVDKITTQKEAEELIEANVKESYNKGKEEGLQELVAQLPPEIQMAIDYTMSGGSDVRSLLRALSTVDEIRELSTDTVEGQEEIVANYLEAKRVFKTKQEIKEQIQEWKDLNKLKAKSEGFKVELEELQKKQVQAQIEQQKRIQEQERQAAEHYRKNVFDALKDSDLGGIKLDKKTQTTIQGGLLSMDFESITGGSTNLLGHLLEKYQFVEPNYKLIAEATWLLSDPEGYRKKMRETIKADVDNDTVRKLRSAQGKNQGAAAPSEAEPQKNKIKRSGFFSLNK